MCVRTPRGPPFQIAADKAASAIVDETLTPLLGFSAPNRVYPLVNHLRGLLAHLAFGVATAGVTAAGSALPHHRP